MSRTFDRLEIALQIWEDRSTFLRLGYLEEMGRLGRSRITATGPVVFAHEFRKFLLQLRPGADPTRDQLMQFAERFVANNSQTDYYGQLVRLPGLLMNWTRNSRRIFHMSRDLQLLLDATDIDDIVLNDITFPFDTFTVQLELPIITEDGHSFDTILVNKTSNGNIEGLLLDAQLYQYERLSSDHVAKCEREIKRKNWGRALKFHQKLNNRIERAALKFRHANTVGLEKESRTFKTQLYGNSAQDNKVIIPSSYEEASRSYKGRMLRIVVGLCLYLSTLPTGSPHVSAWKNNSQHGHSDPRAITHEAQVCLVSNAYEITGELREALEHSYAGHSGHELSAHFRRGHWRRAPGTASDPFAPKIIQVRPTLVRRDRLEMNTLPGGSAAIVK